MLSLCLIVRDEEEEIFDFLNKLKDHVDEIIIVDTGSKDKTKKIAKKFGKVYDFKWNDDFSKARNFSISKANFDWILILDPDEVVDEKDLVKIKEIIRKKDILGYRIIQETYYNDKIISTRGICRLFRNDKRIKFVYPIHETVRNSIKEFGKIGKTGIVIKHYPKINKNKKDYYLKLLKVKKEKFPESNVNVEIENERRETRSIC